MQGSVLGACRSSVTAPRRASRGRRSTEAARAEEGVHGAGNSQPPLEHGEGRWVQATWRTADRQMEYEVVWEKYPDKNTWEPYNHLSNAQEKLHEYISINRIQV